MKHIVPVVVLTLLSAAFAVAGERANNEFRPVPILPSPATGTEVMDIITPMLAGFPGEEEGAPKIELTMTSVDGEVHFDLIETGFADDSVAGQNHRGVIIKTEHGWELKRLSAKWICARGNLSAEGLCP